MRGQLAPQAQEILGPRDLVLLTERVDDVALLLGQRVHRGLPEGLDRHIPRPWTPRGLRGGGPAVIGLASIVTEGDHRQGSLETSRTGLPHPRSPLPAQSMAPLECSDDRVRPLLTHVRQPDSWHARERALHERRRAMDDVAQHVIRCEAPTVSGAPEGTAGGVGQVGHSQEEPTRPPIKVMLGSFAPWGMPLATEVGSGERADDGVDIPLLQRIRPGWKTSALVCVGAGKRRALATRTSLGRPQDWYGAPLPLPGATAAALEAWSPAGGTRGAAGA
jgi:hypothetical protein